jgi:hypothetical protein
VLVLSIIRAMIILMMEAARSSETSVNVYQTARRNNPEDSHQRIYSFCVYVQANVLTSVTKDNVFKKNWGWRRE